MSSEQKLPFYQDVDGFRIPGIFSSECLRSALNYKPIPGDLFIATFPKCGTTWTQQIITLILNKGESVKSFAEFHQRTPFLELLGEEGVEKMVKPGSIKVHLPYNLTPKSDQAKYLYVVRNPKDALVSFYHHTCHPMYMFGNGDFNDFFELFMNGQNDFGDYFDHVLSWYEHRDDPNVMFLTYEELKRDNVKSIKKIAKFMGDEFFDLLENDEDVLNKVIKNSSLEFMKDIFNVAMGETTTEGSVGKVDNTNIMAGLLHVRKEMERLSIKADAKFDIIRKGIVGDWRSNFTEDQAARMDAKIKSKLEGTDLYIYWKSIECI